MRILTSIQTSEAKSGPGSADGAAEQTSHFPGLVEPPSARAGVEERARTSASAGSSLLDTGSSPVADDRRAAGRATVEDSTHGPHASPAPVLGPEREEFRRLYRAGLFAECRRLAETMIWRGVERAAWVRNLAITAYEQGSVREAYSVLLAGAEMLDPERDPHTAANYCLALGAVSQAMYERHGLVREYVDRAEWAYRAAARLYEAAGLKFDSAHAALNLGWLYAASTDTPERAHEHLYRAELLFGGAGESARVADVDDTRALAYEAAGDLASAFACSSRAVLSLQEFGEAERASFDKACETHGRIFDKLRAR